MTALILLFATSCYHILCSVIVFCVCGRILRLSYLRYLSLTTACPWMLFLVITLGCTFFAFDFLT
jgi:hypothetical protein